MNVNEEFMDKFAMFDGLGRAMARMDFEKYALSGADIGRAASKYRGALIGGGVGAAAGASAASGKDEHGKRSVGKMLAGAVSGGAAGAGIGHGAQHLMKGKPAAASPARATARSTGGSATEYHPEVHEAPAAAGHADLKSTVGGPRQSYTVPKSEAGDFAKTKNLGEMDRWKDGQKPAGKNFRGHFQDIREKHRTAQKATSTPTAPEKALIPGMGKSYKDRFEAISKKNKQPPAPAPAAGPAPAPAAGPKDFSSRFQAIRDKNRASKAS